MAATDLESVEDRKGLLSAEDHMRDMERVRMEVVALVQPFPSVTRVIGRIETDDPGAWMPANLAVRVDVEEGVGQRAVNRIYTIRSFDPTTCHAEIDFVMHPDDSPAMRWLAAARPGTVVTMIGPRQHLVPNHADARPAAVFADETAIPAVYAMLMDWPSGLHGSLWIETADRAAFDDLPQVVGTTRHLLLRNPDQPPGTTLALLNAARALPDPKDWTVWAAGERQEMRDLRSHFRDNGLARDDLRVVGYWKLGTSSSEVDRIRLAEYEKIRERGLTLEELPDADLPI